MYIHISIACDTARCILYPSAVMGVSIPLCVMGLGPLCMMCVVECVIRNGDISVYVAQRLGVDGTADRQTVNMAAR